MKNRWIAIAAGGLLLFGALTFVTFGPPAVFAAEPAEESYPEDSPGAWLESLLDRLVERGFIEQEVLDEIEDEVPDEVREFLGRPFGSLRDGEDLEQFRPRILGGSGFDFLRDAIDELTPDELRDAIENGTIDELIDVDAVIEAAEEQVTELVADGSISAEEGEEMLDSLTERLEALRNGDGLGRIEGFRFRILPRDFELDDVDPRPFLGRGFGWFGGDALEDVLGDITPDELRDALEDGTVDELIDPNAILQSTIDSIEEAVEEGRLSAEQAEELIERLERRLEEFGEGGFPFGGRGFGFFGPWHGEDAISSGTSA